MVASSESAPVALFTARSAERAEPRVSDTERLAALLNAEFAIVRRFLRRFGVPMAGLDDAAQEVFIVAARRLSEIEAGRERPYLYGIALRVASNARRAQKNLRAQASELAAEAASASTTAPGPDALLERKQLRLLLDRFLDALPEEQRAAFVLFELEGFSMPEVAEMCGIPLGTAASRLRRARDAFQAEAARLKLGMERVRVAPKGGSR